jgi:hypothetical protein
MTKAIRIHAYGGPEVLQWDDVDVGKPGAGEIRIKQEAAGLNYIDIYHRTGLYKLEKLPAVMNSRQDTASLMRGRRLVPMPKCGFCPPIARCRCRTESRCRKPPP